MNNANIGKVTTIKGNQLLPPFGLIIAYAFFAAAWVKVPYTVILVFLVWKIPATRSRTHILSEQSQKQAAAASVVGTLVAVVVAVPFELSWAFPTTTT